MEIKGATTYSTDWENKVIKMFIITLGNWIELESTPQSQMVHLVPERYSLKIYLQEYKIILLLLLIIIISKFLAQDNDFPAFWLVP